MPKNPILDVLLKAHQSRQGNVETMFAWASDTLVKKALSGHISEDHILEALNFLENQGQDLDKYAQGCIAGTIVLLTDNCRSLHHKTRFLVNWVGCRCLGEAEMNHDIAAGMSKMAEDALKFAPSDIPVQMRVYLLCQLGASTRFLSGSKKALSSLNEALSLCRQLKDSETDGFEPDIIKSHLEDMSVLFGLLGDKESSVVASKEAKRWSVSSVTASEGAKRWSISLGYKLKKIWQKLFGQ